MTIVVLDGYAMNPGDLSWSTLQSFGPCAIYDRTSESEILDRAKNAVMILTNKVPLTKETLAQLPRLKYIGVTATGYNIVDIAAAHAQNITVTNVPAYSTHSVAQLVFALLLELTHHTGHHSHAVRSGRWSANSDFSFWDFPLTELAGKTFGIIGYGNIGKAVAKIALAFEMKVLVSSRSSRTQPVDALITSQLSPPFEIIDTDSLLRRSDIVSLHCALTKETDRLINTQRLTLMKPSALLINTGRGRLVDEAALADALNNGRLAGAGLDVLATEPPPKENPLLSAKNCIITPHFAWASEAARLRLLTVVINNIRSYIAGDPQNVIS
ncbi:MAG: D-2-hydroxyacid dehydrogenase [Bacteriovoracaceae bacterium]|nr:D-2-hydroxyacid dehydrogenase [Bacteroidota bacterium]